jgi:hypothetical protein
MRPFKRIDVQQPVWDREADYSRADAAFGISGQPCNGLKEYFQRKRLEQDLALGSDQSGRILARHEEYGHSRLHQPKCRAKSSPSITGILISVTAKLRRAM